MTTSEKLKEISISYIEAGWQKGDVESLDRILAPNFINRGSNGGATPEGFKKGIIELFTGMPDFKADVEDIIVDAAAGKAAIRWTGAGAQTGSMMEMPPTGKRLIFRGIDIIRIENERIAERWGESNAAEAFGQM